MVALFHIQLSNSPMRRRASSFRWSHARTANRLPSTDQVRGHASPGHAPPSSLGGGPASSVLLFGFRSAKARSASCSSKERFASRSRTKARSASSLPIEGAERHKAHPGCLLLHESRRPNPAGPGLALRRSTAAFVRTLAPRLPSWHLWLSPRRTRRGKDRALGVCLTPGGTSKAARDRDCEPRPQAPLPAHTQHACRASLRRTGMDAR
jgi:hypothetical protein